MEVRGEGGGESYFAWINDGHDVRLICSWGTLWGSAIHETKNLILLYSVRNSTLLS